METMQGPDGGTVEALIEGDGDEAVVFVHASASGIAQWRAYQQALSDRYVTAAVHLYGYGATTPWGRPYRQRLADQAGLVGTVIQAIGRPTWIGSAMMPFASARSFFPSISITRSSVPPRTKAIDLPSGENCGA